MPDKKRYQGEKQRKQDQADADALFANLPDHVRNTDPTTLQEQADLFENILAYVEHERRRELAARSPDGNAAQQAKAVIRLANFAAKCGEVISTPISDTHAARIIAYRGLDTRKIDAIAKDVKRVRKGKQSEKN